MDKPFLSLDQHKLGYVSPDDKALDFHRTAARAVLRNDKGQVAVIPGSLSCKKRKDL